MKLEPAEKRAILRGDRPSLARETKEKPEKGETIILQESSTLGEPAAVVSLKIMNVKRAKDGKHIPEYSVRDDRGSYLRHRGGVTRSPSESVDPEAPLVDPDFQRLLAEEGEQKTILLGNGKRQHESIVGARGKLSREYAERKAGG